MALSSVHAASGSSTDAAINPRRHHSGIGARIASNRLRLRALARRGSGAPRGAGAPFATVTASVELTGSAL